MSTVPDEVREFEAARFSLGRRDGLIQFLYADDSPHKGVLIGHATALFKETIVRGAAWTARCGVPAHHILVRES